MPTKVGTSELGKDQVSYKKTIPTTDFIYVDTDNSHKSRKALLVKSYPEVKNFMGPYPKTALWILALVSLQLFFAYTFSELHWGLILLLSFGVGAFFSHGLYVLIHECTHNLVFKTSLANRWMGIVCDLPLVLPSAMAFRKYHMLHHRYLGEYDGDPDVASYKEARLVGNHWLKKLLWVILFSISQALRPSKIAFVKLWDRWIVLNLVIIILANAAIYYYLGGGALLYLALSTFFGLGLHPLGGRWIQEHYVTQNEQETYSYYGPLNKLTFNMGYHNEHHDLMNVPWIHLPKVKKTAPEFYNHLKSYTSWTGVLFNFIFNPKMSSFNRIIHASTRT